MEFQQNRLKASNSLSVSSSSPFSRSMSRGTKTSSIELKLSREPRFFLFFFERNVKAGVDVGVVEDTDMFDVVLLAGAVCFVTGADRF